MTPRAAHAARSSETAMDTLKRWVLDQTGLAYYESRDAELTERIERRIAETRAEGPAAYLALLQSAERGETEFDALIGVLTIGETYFFRHAEQFAALTSRVLPDLLERRKATRRLRIWSAGCSTGAEAYSIAIALRRDLGERLDGWSVGIVATDINRGFLECAQEGRYGEWALRGTSPELRDACFIREGKSWLLKREYREQVSFRYHNLVKHPFPSLAHNLFAFDLILCRNVMIYWDAATVARAAGQFRDCLSEGGWLFVGHAEVGGEFQRLFHRVEVPGAVVYQRVPDAEATPNASNPAPVIAPEIPIAPPPPVTIKAATPAAAGPELAEEVRELARRGELELAARRGQVLLEQAKLDPKLHYYCALVEEGRGRDDEAATLLRRAIFLDRHFVMAHFQLATVLRRRGDAESAMRSLRNALKLVSRIQPAQMLPASDSLTVGELTEILRGQLDSLEKECSKKR